MMRTTSLMVIAASIASLPSSTKLTLLDCPREGAAGVEGAVTAGTELLPPVSTSTRLTGKTNGFMYMKHASSEIKVKSSNNENS